MKPSSIPQPSFVMFFRFILVLIFFGCAGEQAKVDHPQSTNEVSHSYTISDSLKAGIVYSLVEINNDKLNSFAIYLPKLYDRSTSWPVVFFFDPSGNGAIPIKKYTPLADSLGYILIGSNVSKNGQDAEDIKLMWNTLKNACFNYLALDKNNIILAGFSGGARTACMIASNEPGISSVIANSAGTPEPETVLNPNTMFIGIAGKGDMNRAEMSMIEQHLSGTAHTHYYIEFEGIHEWAPIKIMHQALHINYLNAYSKDPSIVDQNKLNAFITMQKTTIAQLKEQKKLVDACNQMIILFETTKFFDHTAQRETIDSLKKSTDYLAEKSQLLSLNIKETKIQQDIYEMMITKPDTLLWKVKIGEFKKNALGKNEIGMMHQRLLSYASLVCYSLSNRLLMAKNYQKAANMVRCYQIADPNNAEVYYFNAIIEAQLKNKSAVLLSLSKAIAFGFNDKLRLANETEFEFMRNETEFQALLK